MNIKQFQKIIVVFIVITLILQGLILIKVTKNNAYIESNRQSIDAANENINRFINDYNNAMHLRKLEKEEASQLVKQIDYKISAVNLKDKSYDISFDVTLKEFNNNTDVSVSLYDKSVQLEKVKNHYKGILTVNLPLPMDDEITKPFEVSISDGNTTALEEYIFAVPTKPEKLFPVIRYFRENLDINPSSYRIDSSYGILIRNRYNVICRKCKFYKINLPT